MCFSPEASFVASGGLTLAGGVSVYMSRKKNILFALVPFLFALQQASEGIQWLYLAHSESSLIAAYVFAFFAFLIWPVYIPVALYMLEPERRKTLKWFVVLGGFVSVLYVVGLITNPLSVHILEYSIDYSLKVPFGFFTQILYIVTVIGSLVTSRRKYVRLIGVAIFLAAVIAEAFFYLTFTSVWCFFSALVSSLILWYIYQDSRIKMK